MASWQRSPRGLVLLILIVVSGLYFFLPLTEEGSLESGGLSVRRKTYDHSLESKLHRSDAIYEKMLVDRKGLIQKFGPTPKEIALFPPNVRPWPPYTVWDFFPPMFNCPHEMQRIGALGDGGKWVCGLSRLQTKPDCIIYSFGINYESSFEAGILENTDHCQVWGYDFSVSSFGPEIKEPLASRAHFQAFGLAGSDKTGPNDVKMYTLDTLMKQNGHTHIDILKIDIEGYEFETLTTLVKSYMDAGKPLPFGQLQLEIHLWNKSFEEFLTWWEMLEAAGLRPFMTEPNMVYQNYNRQSGSDLAEYSFINRKSANAFTSDIFVHRHGA